RFEPIVSWISTVGAGIALGDLDGDGLSNDACLVDPRTDQVILTAVPGAVARYAPFTLVPAPFPHESIRTAPMGCLFADLNENVGTGWTLAMGACDLDGDLRPEIYIANDFGPDRLLYNKSTPGHVAFKPLRGRRGWTTPKSKVLGQDSFKGMGVDCADLNGDGLPDLMVGNITDPYALEESNLVYLSTGELGAFQSGVAPYQERSESLGLARSGWSWDVRFGDFDNRGDQQILQATGFLKGATNRWPEL